MYNSRFIAVHFVHYAPQMRDLVLLIKLAYSPERYSDRLHYPRRPAGIR